MRQITSNAGGGLRSEFAGRRIAALADGFDQFVPGDPFIGGLASENRVERRPQAKDIRRRPEDIDFTASLFGTHEGQSADDAAILGGRRAFAGKGGDSGFLGLFVVSLLADRLGDAPIDDERFAVLAEHDVAGLQIAVEDTPTVRVFDRVADIDEPAEEFVEDQPPLIGGEGVRVGIVQAVDGFFEAIAANEAHDVEGRTGFGSVEAVDGDDAGMFKAASDFALEEKPRPAVGVTSKTRLQFFQGDLTLKLAIFRQGDLSQPSLSMQFQDTEAGFARLGGLARRFATLWYATPGFARLKLACRQFLRLLVIER